jgi:hypothetical protein
LVNLQNWLTKFIAPLYLSATKILHNHIDSIVEFIIDDLEETDDMTVTTFFHDGDFLAYFLLETAQLVGERRVRGGGEVSSTEKIHLLGARIITFHGLYCHLAPVV